MKAFKQPTPFASTGGKPMVKQPKPSQKPPAKMPLPMAKGGAVKKGCK
jgi:hypothetical protein